MTAMVIKSALFNMYTNFIKKFQKIVSFKLKIFIL